MGGLRQMKLPYTFYKLKKYHNLTLSLISGLLLISSWPTSPLTFLIFIAWVPLLILSERTNRIRFYLYSYLTLFVWNAGTTWWIWNATAGGAIGAIILNAWLMCIPLWGYYIIKNKFGNTAGYTSFIVFWMSFEYIHLNWQLSWPWLTLGNIFATQPEWVQWYEYTGTSGGTLWILVVNLLVFLLLKPFYRFRSENPGMQDGSVEKKHLIMLGSATLVCIVLPLVLSGIVEQSTRQPQRSTPGVQPDNVIVVQPNIDPYNEKFQNGSIDGQIQKLVSLSEAELDSNTRLVIWPETAVPVAVAEDAIAANMYFKPLFDFAQRHPHVTLLTGIESYRNYGPEQLSRTARKLDDGYYDFFNAAVYIKNNSPSQFYHKSKLVPGVETLPDFLLWLGPVFEKFGGTTGGYGHDKEAAVFTSIANPYVAAPIICYESIYGEYVASYVRKGATLLTIITNDGWWFNTPGHRQHLYYARLRAIETRRWVARSANTGISAVIDEKGHFLATKLWDEAASIKFNIPAFTGKTFFVRHGDVISRFMLLVACIFLIWYWITAFRDYLRQRALKRHKVAARTA